VAFGMGGGLLQKVNRDTMQFATKLSHIVYVDGSVREVAKMPKTDPAKVPCWCKGQWLGQVLATGHTYAQYLYRERGMVPCARY
jgi:nicotinic acid phosphoribosyltransferase